MLWLITTSGTTLLKMLGILSDHSPIASPETTLLMLTFLMAKLLVFPTFACSLEADLTSDHNPISGPETSKRLVFPIFACNAAGGLIKITSCPLEARCLHKF